MNIDRDNLYEATRQVFDRINDGEYPEVYEYLDTILDEDALYEDDLFIIASTLVHCDEPRKLPDFLVEYITALYESEIRAGNDNAMNDLGSQHYDGGRGFEQSFQKAVYYYRLAAERGNRQAQENLGYCYYYGRDMAPDYEQAYKYFALGALDGQPVSLYKIGDMYLHGYYVDRDEREAFSLYNRCLGLMNDQNTQYVAGPVHLRLADCYFNGWGTKADPESALFHYGLAEIMLYKMVKNGEYMYKKALQSAIEGQSKARAALAGAIPGDTWIDEPVY